jgi:hypothetical protein
MVVDFVDTERNVGLSDTVSQGMEGERVSATEQARMQLEAQFTNPQQELESQRVGLERQYALEDAQSHKPERTRNKNNLLGHNPYVNDSARLFTNPFAELDMALDSGTPLYKSFLGRVEINMLARGVCAAALFTAGAYMVKEWKMGAGVENQEWFAKPLELIADGIDIVLGKPVTSAIAAIPGITEEQAKHFMTFNKYVAKPYKVEEALKEGAKAIQNHEVFGMTLGQAVVDVTWAFAAGSTGAAVGRNIAYLLDPNYKTSWWHNGKVDIGGMLHSTAKETFRILTYNQGEDWAAAIPYLLQRKLISGGMEAAGIGNMWELQNGFGNTHMVDAEGNIGRSHEIAGALDFQTRFMGYNWYTLMYRDLYNHIGHALNDMKENGIHLENPIPENPLEAAGNAIEGSIKYALKSLIKSQIYMAPAVLAFWPQNMGISKYNHALMSEETGQFITTKPTYDFNPSLLEHMQQDFVQGGMTPAYRNGIVARIGAIDPEATYYAGGESIPIHHLAEHDPYSYNGSPLSPVQNVIGRLSHGYANLVHDNITTPLFGMLGMDSSHPDVRWTSDTFARAQLAYFPYMIAKYELAQLWDTPEMDAAIYRALDGITDGKPNEVWQGVQDVGNVVTLQPVSEVTHALIAEPRGLINSTCEAKEKTDASQESMKRAEANERHAHEVSDLVRPLTQIAEAQLSGKTQDVAPNASAQLLALTF